MIKFGVAGYPPAYSDTIYKKDRLKVFQWLKEIGIDAFEAQMTYGPRTLPENCRLINQLSKDFDIKVSVHASYFIVFTSSEKQKIQQSIDTLKRTYELADLMGSDTIVLHPGPLYGEDPDEPLNRIKDNLSNYFNNAGKSQIGLFLETAGKRGQLGSVGEIVDICKEIEGCYPCIDFGHVHARTGGTLNEDDAIDRLFKNMTDIGTFSNFDRIHFHYTPIHYGPKGEIKHKAIEDVYENESQLSFGFDAPTNNFYHPRYNRIVENLILKNLDCTVISETHDSQERGAIAMKNHYKKIIENILI
jgi:deoxyribonuclease-4